MIKGEFVATWRALDLIPTLLLDHEVHHGSRAERLAWQEHDASILRTSYSLCYDRFSGPRDLLCRICNKGITVACGEATRIVVQSTPASEAS